MTKRRWLQIQVPRLAFLAGLALAILTMTACGEPPLRLTGGCATPNPDWVDVPHEVLLARTTFCDSDGATGRIETSDFPAGTHRVDLMMSGYPSTEGMRLEALYTRNGKKKIARLDVADVGDRWAQVWVEIPDRVSRSTFKLRLVDNAREPFGWAGIGQLRPYAWLSAVPFACLFLGTALVCHAWLCALGFAMPSTLTHVTRLVAALLLLGAGSFVTFLAYLPGPTVGRFCSLLLLLLPFVAAIVLFRRRADAWSDLKLFHSRLLPTLLLTLAILWVGMFPFDWNGVDWFPAAARYRELPCDNWLPFMFAEMLLRGVIEHPMVGDWLSSDRPPLQTGLFLIFHPLFKSQPGWVYQACSTWAQMLFLVPLSLLRPALASASGESSSRRQSAVMLLLLGLSPLLFLNGLFVWPKLFAGTFCAIFHLLIFRDDRPEQQRKLDLWAGAAAGFVLLSHGGAICALFGSTLALLCLRGPGEWRRLLYIAPVTAGLLVPWILYQRLVDPPGDRLLKWHFAGQIDVTPEPFAQTFVYAYKNLSFSGWVHNRVSNVQTIFTGSLSFFRDLWELLTSPHGGLLKQTLKRMVENAFYYPVYNALFFGPLVLLLVLSIGLREKKLTWSLWPRGLVLATALGLLVWVFVMFLPASTIVHQGAYFTVAVIPLLIMLAAAQLAPRVFSALAVLQVLVFLAIYVYDRPFADVSRPWVYALGSLLLLHGYWRACQLAVTTELGELA